MEEGGRVQENREGGRNTSAPQSYTVESMLMSCVLGPLGLGVWAPLSYNTVDKKLRDQPSGNRRGGVSRPVGQERGKGQNIAGTLHLCRLHLLAFTTLRACYHKSGFHRDVVQISSQIFPESWNLSAIIM